MRETIEPADRKGEYFDEIRAEDLIIIGTEPEKAAGRIGIDAGILGSLWRLSVETDLGMIVDVRRIPMEQAFIDKCNLSDINPYEQPLSGYIYISHPMSEYHLRRDMTVIGYLTERKVCKLVNGDRESFLNR